MAVSVLPFLLAGTGLCKDRSKASPYISRVATHAPAANGNLLISSTHIEMTGLFWPELSAAPTPVTDMTATGSTTWSSSRSNLFLTPAAPAPVVRNAIQKPPVRKESFQWLPALKQSATFLLVEHSFRIYKEGTTRKELAGPFFADYVESVEGLGGWGDGDEFYVNYVGHPMQGAVSGFIEVQNDPRGRKMQFGDQGYFKNRLRAMAFAAAYSVQFEIGPLSECSIGNVGRDRRPDLPNGGQGWVDLVITPTVGTGWLIGEDILDRFVVQKLEAKTSNRFLQTLARGLTPSYAFANLMAGRVPWHRYTRPGIWEAR